MALSQITRSKLGHALFRWVGLGLLPIAAASAVLNAEAPPLAVELSAASCWPSGTLGIGATEPLVAADGEIQGELEDFVQGDLDLSSLDAGHHRIPIQITDNTGGISNPFYVDVFVYESDWQPSSPSTDSDADGLPDEWELLYFGSLEFSSASDVDNDGLSNLEELQLGSDPTTSVSPPNRLVRAEYYIDHDPGLGEGIPLNPGSTPILEAVESFTIPGHLTRHLEPGRHVVGIRVQRESGNWSNVFTADFYVFIDTEPPSPPQFEVSTAEYFWDDPVSPEAGEPLSLVTDSSSKDARSIESTGEALSSGQDPGIGRLYYRVSDNNSLTSSARWHYVEVAEPDPFITDVPYYMDSILGTENFFMNGTQLSGIAFDSSSPRWLDYNGIRYSLLGVIGTGDSLAFLDGWEFQTTLTEGGTLTWLWGLATYNVDLVNDYGKGIGKGPIPRFSEVTSSVPQYVYTSENTRFRCLGYSASGSAPASGDSNTVTYFLAEDTQIIWQWQKQYRVAMESRHGEVDGWEEWYDNGTVTSLLPRPDAGYQFDRWSGDLTGNTVPGEVLVTTPLAIRANFQPTEDVVLRIIEIDGTESTSSHTKGTVLDLEPAVAEVQTGRKRIIASGWRSEGALYKSGDGRRVTLSLTRDTTLYWLATTQFRLNPRIIPSDAGEVIIEGRQSASDPDWYDAGPIRLRAVPSAGHRFVDWYFQQWDDGEVETLLMDELPLVARFAQVEPLGVFETIQGGFLNSPNTAVSHFTDYHRTSRFKKTEVTAQEYAEFLNWAQLAGYIETSNHISVRAQNPLAEYVPGLKGEWYRGDDWTVDPEFTNIVDGLEADFGAGGPDLSPYGNPACPFTEADFFSFRLRGEIFASVAGLVSFKEMCDDQVTILINGAVVLDNANALVDSAVQVVLNEGWNEIEIVYLEITGKAKFHVVWDPAGDVDWQPIPGTALRHKALSSLDVGLVAEYTAPNFYHGKELVDLDTVECNIERVGDYYQAKSGFEDHPAVDITWYGAMAFSRWLSEAAGEPVTLPTEWLWEYAASSGNSTLTGYYYPWGPRFLGASHNYANYFGTGGLDTFNGTSPVATFPEFHGLYDAGGNVFEWTNTLYEIGDPTDPFRVLRGGSWNQPDTFLALSNRQIYKNENFSDKATGFRPAVVYPTEQVLEGYVYVPVDSTVESPNATRSDYDPPVAAYFLKANEVTNLEYADFLNWAFGQGYASLDGSVVLGAVEGWGDGFAWLELDASSGIEVIGGEFFARPAMENTSVAFVSWYGAKAYCDYLGVLNPGLLASLPSQWQWENAMLRGVVSPRFQDESLFSWNIPVIYDTSFWPGFFDAVGGLQEWTSSIPSPEFPDRAVVRGSAFNLPALFRSFTKADQHASKVDTRQNLGFRPAIVHLAPKIIHGLETIVATTSGDPEEFSLTATSLGESPGWNWSIVSGPSWITLADLGNGRATLTITPPAAATSGVVEVLVSDGLLDTTTTIGYQVVSAGGFVLSGLPEEITFREGDTPTTLVVHAGAIGAAGAPGSWSLAGDTQGCSLSQDGSRVTLTIDPIEAGVRQLSVLVSDGTYQGSDTIAIVTEAADLQFVDFPHEIEFLSNRLQMTVPLEVKWGSAAKPIEWSVDATVSTWARFVVNNDRSAILEVDRSGFLESAVVPIFATDGVTTISGEILFYEGNQAPSITLRDSHFQVVAGAVPGRFLIVAEDPNQADSLDWSILPEVSWLNVTPVSGRSAELLIDASAVQSLSGFTLSVSDGIHLSQANIQVEVVNNAPSVAGSLSPIALDEESGIHSFFYTVTDPDRFQGLSIAVGPDVDWLDWYYTDDTQVQVEIDTSQSVDGYFDVTYSDGFAPNSSRVFVSVAPVNGTPRIGQLPNELALARFDTPLRLPFVLEDADVADALTASLGFPIEGTKLEMTGSRDGFLILDPIQEIGEFSVVVQVDDGQESVRHEIRVTILDPDPDSFEIVACEYFIDVAPDPGSGIPVPSTNNEVFSDAASFARLLTLPSDIAPGWHRIGIRCKTVSGQWSSITWRAFYAYDDQHRMGYSSSRDDGDLLYGRWSEFGVIGRETGPQPDGFSSFEDLDSSSQGITDGASVFEDMDGVEDLSASIVWAEYFVDSDPGVGNGIQLPIDRRNLDSSIEDISFVLDSSALAPGRHTVGMRIRDIQGRWGQTRKMDVYVYVDRDVVVPPSASVVESEFSWDINSSPGFGNTLELDSAYADSEIGVLDNLTIQTVQVDTGVHNLFVWFKDDEYNWGNPRRWTVTIDSPDGLLDLVNLHVESNIGISGQNYDTWQLVGSTVSLHVPITYTVNDLVYANFGYIGQGSAPSFGTDNSVTFEINQASDITWIWGRDCEVTSRTSFGDVSGNGSWVWYPDFSTGYGIFEPLQEVLLSVPATVGISPGTRQRCTGWTGTGSAPLVGIENSVSFSALAQSSEIDWNWLLEHALDVEVVGEGQVFGNDGWIASGQTEMLNVVPNPGHRFVRWELANTSTEGSIGILMDAPKQLRAVFTEHRVWVVDPLTLERTLFGVFEDGAEVVVTSPETLAIQPGSRAVVTGWTGVGDAPVSGAGSIVSFVVHQDSEIRWRATRQHWVDAQANNSALGTVSLVGDRTLAESSWYDEGLLEIAALPQTGARFVRWIHDLNGAPEQVAVYLNAPLQVAGVFRANQHSPVKMISVPGGSIAASPNASEATFTSWVYPFEVSPYEITNQVYVDELNLALNEGSIRVVDSKVIGRREIPSYWTGLLATWNTQGGEQVQSSRIADLSDAQLDQPQGHEDSLNLTLVGEVFISPRAESTYLHLTGSGTVSLYSGGSPIVVGEPLPAVIPFNFAEGWQDVILAFNRDSVGDAVTIKLSDLAGDLENQLFAGYLRSGDPEGLAPLSLASARIGSSPEELEGISLSEVLNGELNVDPSIGYFNFTAIAEDASLRAQITAPVTGKVGIMVRQSLRDDSSFLSICVQDDGRLLTQYRLESQGDVEEYLLDFPSLEEWTIRLDVTDGVVTASYLSNGGWLDSTGSGMQLNGYPIQDLTGDNLLVGVYGDSAAIVSGIQFSELHSRTNYEGAVLADMAWPGCQFAFDGSEFYVVSGKENRPATAVSLFGAAIFASWIEDRFNDGDYALPTEWQYEYLMGVSFGLSHPWPAFADSTQFANLHGPEKAHSEESLAEVGAYSSFNGVFDLAGNAWEWTSSPHWQGRGPWNNIRGGSFRQSADISKASFRLYYGRNTFLSSELGFRIVRNLETHPAVGPRFSGDQDYLAESVNSFVRGIGLKEEAFEIGAAQVSNGDYAVFLNNLYGESGINITDGWAYSIAAGYHSGRGLVRLDSNPGLVFSDGEFLAVAGLENSPVTCITWYGAHAYALYLTAHSSSWRYDLPSEWEWENAVLGGYNATPVVQSEAKFSNAFGLGSSALDGVENLWGLSGMLVETADWTSSSPNDYDGLRVVRGAPLGLFKNTSSLSARVYYLAPDEESSAVGFRVVRKFVTPWSGISSDGKLSAVLESPKLFEGMQGVLVITRTGDPVFSKTVFLSTNDSRIEIAPSATFGAGQSMMEIQFQITADIVSDGITNAELTIQPQVGSGVQVDLEIVDWQSPVVQLDCETQDLVPGSTFDLKISRTGYLGESVVVLIGGDAQAAFGLSDTYEIPSLSETLNVVGTVPLAAGNYNLTAIANWMISDMKSLTVQSVLDTDSDGIPDQWENERGLNPTVSNTGLDSDADGQLDYDEYVYDTDPLTAASLFQPALRRTESGLKIVFPTVIGRTYRILKSSDLKDWEIIHSVDGDGAHFELGFSDPVSGVMNSYSVEVMLQ